MSHDIHATWAATEISRLFNSAPSHIFSDCGHTLTAYASREGSTSWPLADGVINIEVDGRQAYRIAIEFKRTNEGIHGVLTALGQAHAYLHKGYDASLIVIPQSYETHDCPGSYLNDVLSHTSTDIPIGIVVYEQPNESLASPFENKLNFIRLFDLSTLNLNPVQSLSRSSSKTQWAHLREGISTPSAFFRYLQISKQLDINSLSNPNVSFLPHELVEAVDRIQPGQDVIKYLSQTPNDNLSDYTWRHLWFKYVLTPENTQIWSNTTPYVINDACCRLEIFDGSRYMKLFAGRSDSIKNKLVDKLNSGEISEDEAWEEYAKTLKENAHSYKEILDSGLEHLRLLGNDGKPTDIGYKYVDACERNSEVASSGTPRSILGSVLLKEGQLNAFLHYVFKLSNNVFKSNPLKFTSTNQNDRLVFNGEEYRAWLFTEMSNNLRVIKTSSTRGGVPRKAFQAELALLKKFDFVDSFRIGIGLEINWPLVQHYIDIEY